MPVPPVSWSSAFPRWSALRRIRRLLRHRHRNSIRSLNRDRKKLRRVRPARLLLMVLRPWCPGAARPHQLRRKRHRPNQSRRQPGRLQLRRKLPRLRRRSRRDLSSELLQFPNPSHLLQLTPGRHRPRRRNLRRRPSPIGMQASKRLHLRRRRKTSGVHLLSRRRRRPHRTGVRRHPFRKLPRLRRLSPHRRSVPKRPRRGEHPLPIPEISSRDKEHPHPVRIGRAKRVPNRLHPTRARKVSDSHRQKVQKRNRKASDNRLLLRLRTSSARIHSERLRRDSLRPLRLSKNRSFPLNRPVSVRLR